MSRLAFICSLLALLPAPLTAAGAPGDGTAASAPDFAVADFFTEHCVKCHGPEKQKGDVRLDTLPLEAVSLSARDTWRKVLEVLDAGEMPPAKEPRPEGAELDAMLGQVSRLLRSGEPLPRPPLRRLNRVEYEHTVQDLLGVTVPLADLLPEDGSVQGFDTVADGLSLSSVLLERYLEAADTAFEAVIRRIRPLPAETRRVVLMENPSNRESVAEHKGGVIEVEGAFVKFTPGWPPARLDEVHPIEDGVYRCRLAVWPHDPGERTLALAVYVGPLFGSGKRHFMGMFDVTGTPQDPRLIEFTTFMQENDALHLVPWVYPEHVTWRDKEEPRPGIGIVWAETHGPLDQSWPSEAQQELFGGSESLSMAEGRPIWMRHRKGVKRQHVESETPEEDVARILGAFVPRAFRRPVAPELRDAFVALALDRLRDGAGFEQAVRAGVTAVLCSPHFLLLNASPETDDYALASRLSFFLWSSLPDAELLELAGQGRLSESKVLHEQVDRLIADPRFDRFVRHFTGQWLDLRDIEFTTPDTKLYPEFDALLQESMLRESRDFFAHVVTNNLSVMNFVDADFTFLNERLARHYGMDGVRGHERTRRVTLPEGSVRGGVLTQASVLKVTANGTTTSPVLRGVWVLDKLLGRPPSPPPPGVPAVEPDIRGATTIREQLTRHREDPSCARCHDRIDPPGFALERFDPIGGERARYRSLGEGDKVPKRNYRLGLPVDDGGQTEDGRRFDDFMAFRRWLAGQRETVARAMAAKLLVYGTGRPVRLEDREVVDEVVAATAADDHGMRRMIHAVVESAWFRGEGKGR